MGTINLTRLSAWTAFFVICFTSLWLFGKSDANAATKIDASPATVIARSGLPRGVAVDFGPAPKSPSGALSTKTIEALDTAFGDFGSGNWGAAQRSAMRHIARSKDPRLAWIISDAMRFVGSPGELGDLVPTLNTLLGTNLKGLDAWNDSVNHLIAWDIPAPPDYLRYKRDIYTRILPQWAPLFQPGTIDWRHVAWGGVRIDDRPFDKTDERCNCIPAADNPEVTNAKNADWLTEDAVVFGISLNGEHRAYARQIMVVREMVNDTLGGRDLGIPYCTLCGSAQAWFTDDVPEGVERPILRTSGLLIRSNKVMYDLVSQSVFDTFLGTAVTGNLGRRGVQLSQASVITTTWGEWKAAHPDTTVLAERLALGRNFNFREGRDANGPIFPIGNADPRLAVQEDVLGVVTKAGTPLAFHIPSVIAALNADKTVQVGDVKVVLDSGGVKAIDTEGNDLGTHQAFWFAWSQFHPDTKLWPTESNI